MNTHTGLLFQRMRGVGIFSKGSAQESDKGTMNLNEQRLRGALARGYCAKDNSAKVLDPDLIEAMVIEVKKEFDDPDLPAVSTSAQHSS
jgi:hypothetical protein